MNTLFLKEQREICVEEEAVMIFRRGFLFYNSIETRLINLKEVSALFLGLFSKGAVSSYPFDGWTGHYQKITRKGLS